MEDLNSVNAEQENAVDSQDEINEQEESEKKQESAEPVKAQEKDENAKYAAARREAETKAKQIEEKAKKDNTIARQYGKDYEIFSEEDIKTKYNMNLEEFENALLQESYKQAGIDPELINKAISNHPLIKQAEQLLTKTQEEQRQQWVKDDISNLHKEFPETVEIKTEQDLYSLPEWKEIYAYTQKGYELSDAYYKVNKSKVLEKTQKDAEKRTIANVQDRLKRGITGASDNINGDDADASDVDVEMARAFGNDPKEIAKYVKKTIKEMRT